MLEMFALALIIFTAYGISKLGQRYKWSLFFQFLFLVVAFVVYAFVVWYFTPPELTLGTPL